MRLRTRNALYAASIAFALGVLTAYAQEWLPSEVGSLANSTGAWALTAFGLAMLARRLFDAAALGCLALVALLAGYVVGAGVRGDTSSRSLILFWGLSAIVAGPCLGIAAFWVKTARDIKSALGTAAMSGVLVGEGAYGLMEIADTTYPPFWWAEIAAGLALLLWSALRRLASRVVPVAIAATAAVAMLFVVLYRADLISVLP